MTRSDSDTDPFLRMIQQTEEAWTDWLTSLTPKSQQVCEQLATVEPPEQTPQYHVLLIPEMDEPTLVSFDTVQEAAELLRTKVDQKALRVFVFLGWRARISKKPFRYLIHPNGTPYPLFSLPDQIEIQEDDMLGPDPDAEMTSTIGEDYEEENAEDNWEDADVVEEEVEAAEEDDDSDIEVEE